MRLSKGEIGVTNTSLFNNILQKLFLTVVSSQNGDFFSGVAHLCEEKKKFSILI